MRLYSSSGVFTALANGRRGPRGCAGSRGRRARRSHGATAEARGPRRPCGRGTDTVTATTAGGATGRWAPRAPTPTVRPTAGTRGSTVPLPATAARERDTRNTHRLQDELHRCLICFDPHPFVPQRQESPRRSPSPLVFQVGSTDFNRPPPIPPPSTILEPTSRACPSVRKVGTHGKVTAAYGPCTLNVLEHLPSPTYRDCWHDS